MFIDTLRVRTIGVGTALVGSEWRILYNCPTGKSTGWWHKRSGVGGERFAGWGRTGS